MATVVNSFAIQGVDAFLVDIEIKIMQGVPSISIIGLGDLAVKEAAERIESAIDESGYIFPKKRVIISLAPSDLKKFGSHFDLAMAIGVLQENESIDIKDINQYKFIGELALDGRVRASRGILPMIISAKAHGFKKIIVPIENVNEAKLVKDIEIYGFEKLLDVIEFLEGKTSYNEKTIISIDNDLDKCYDFADVKGQDELIDAVILAACGGHNLLMIGAPGCGKTMIAERIPSILPIMTEEESLEVTKIYSISGLLPYGYSLIRNRPFRSPHHNASLNSLIGGGVNALPGEISLAHNGVLFLDELTEFSRRTLDALRQPIEDKKVSIARVNGTHTYPSNFMLIAAMNPCLCGFYPDKKCRCTDYEIIKYRNKISGPIMDRIDIQKEVKPINYFSNCEVKKRCSKDIRYIVEHARKVQHERFKEETGVFCNAQMNTTMLQKYCTLDDESIKLLKYTSEKYGYSARVIHKMIRMARTNADINERENINVDDIEKILTYRDLDKSNNEMLVVKC